MTTTEASNATVSGALTEIEVKINGVPYSSQQAPIIRAAIETSLRMPAMAMICLADDADHSKAKDFAIDTQVEISFGGVGSSGDDKRLAFKGTVATLEGHRMALEGLTIVRCHDDLSKLYGARKTRTFLQNKYADIASSIAREHGLAVGSVAATGPTHPYVVQYDESDGDFLERLAAEYGFVMYLDKDWKFVFGPPPQVSSAPYGSYASAGGTQLIYGDDLISYEVIHGPKSPVSSVKTIGWNIGQVAKVVSQETIASATKVAEFKNLTLPAGSGDFLVSSIPFRTTEGATASAKGVRDQIAASTASFRGRLTGNPFISAGVEISIGPPEHSFAGRFIVSSATHRYEQGILTTEVVSDGLGDRGLAAGGSAAPASAAALPNSFPFVTVGIVDNIDDNTQDDEFKNLGRVRVTLPSLGLDQNAASTWLRVVGAGNGDKRGTWWLPEVGDEVLCVFEQGDMRSGYVLGGVHNEKAKPEFGATAVHQGKVVSRALTTTTGHQLLFTDKQGEEAIELHSGDKKYVMKFQQKDTVFSLDVAGEMLIKLDKANGISITSNKKITVESKQGDLEMKAMNVKIEATSGDVSVKGMNVKAEAQAGFEAKGATAKVNGSGTAELSSGGQTAVKGSIVQIN